MAKGKSSATQAIRLLHREQVGFEEHPYRYEEGGGTAVSSRELAVPESWVIKTLIMEDETATPYVVLMRGDREVSTKAAARLLGVKTIRACDPKIANRHSGYLIGGTSPFGTKRKMMIVMDQSLTSMDTVYINGGRRGLLISLTTADLVRVLNPLVADIARH